jgi:hypothetical protein
MLDTNDKVVSAIFGNTEQTMIRATIQKSQTKEIHEVNVTSIDGDPFLWNQIISQVPLESIAEQTRDFQALQRRALADTLMNYAKKNNLVYDPSTWSPNTKLSIDNIFDLPEGDVGSDFLFELKLRVFDMPKIAASSDQAVKVAIREAESPLEVFYHAGKILFNK